MSIHLIFDEGVYTISAAEIWRNNCRVGKLLGLSRTQVGIRDIYLDIGPMPSTIQEELDRLKLTPWNSALFLLVTDESFNFGAKALRWMQLEGVNYIHQLVVRRPSEIKKHQGIGPTTVRRIQDALGTVELSLSMRLHSPPYHYHP